MYAPKFDKLLRIYDGKNDLNTRYECNEVKERILKLFDTLSKIKPIDDEKRALYFSVKKGSIKDFCNFNKLKEQGEFTSYEEFVDYFNSLYTKDEYWYRLTSVRNEEYYVLCINNRCILNVDMKGEDDFQDLELVKLIDFLIKKVNECIKKLEKGTYNTYISKNLPYQNRYGTIKRSDYWLVNPLVKEKFMSELSLEEIAYFNEKAKEKTNKRIKDMTASKYFKCARLAYESLNYDTANLDDKDLYLRYSGGGYGDLGKININSVRKFDEWFKKDKVGGHPWEIIMGASLTRINLYVLHDENGYYLALDGRRILRMIELVKIYLALEKNNVPVEIRNVDIIKKAINGDDYLGIVPRYNFLVYCNSYFKKNAPEEFVYLDDMKLVKYVEWEELENIELLK